MGQPRSYWRIPRTASSHSFQTSQITLERRFPHSCPKMDIAIFRKRFAKGSLKFLLTFIFWNWLFERCNDSWHMQQSKPCSGAGIYGRKLLKKNEDTILNYIGEGIQQFQDDVNWTSDKIQEILMLAKLFRPTYFIFKLQSQTEKLLIVVHVMVLMKEHRSLDSARENFWVDYSNNYSKFILLKAICIIPQE